MNAPANGQGAQIGRENARISMAAAQIQLKWNPSDPLCGIQTFTAASALSFGHHP